MARRIVIKTPGRRGIDRRTVLRGMLGGAAITVALPPLEAMMNAHGTAYAQGDAFPLRFGLFSWGNGIIPDRWIPAETGEEWALSEQLEPLADIRDHVTLVTGMEVKLTNAMSHFSGPGGFLSGADLAIDGDDFDFTRPSLDQLIAAQIGDQTRFRSLEVAVETGTKGLSYNGPGSRNPPESDLGAMFDRLFGAEFRAPGEDVEPDPKLRLRRSVLDAVMASSNRLAQRVGSADKRRLDQHFTAVRELELRIARLEESPPDLAACMRPEPPMPVPDIEGRADLYGRSVVVSDLMTMALACDQTRVFSYWHTDPFSDALYPGTTAGHHQLTHDEPGDQPMVHSIVLSVMRSFGYFVKAMQAIEEGDGTLLDRVALLGTTDCSAGRTHQIDEYPIILAGSAGGRLRTGLHYRSETKENASHVPFTLLKTFGVDVPSYGDAEGEVGSGLSALEV